MNEECLRMERKIHCKFRLHFHISIPLTVHLHTQKEVALYLYVIYRKNLMSVVLGYYGFEKNISIYFLEYCTINQFKVAVELYMSNFCL